MKSRWIWKAICTLLAGLLLFTVGALVGAAYSAPLLAHFAAVTAAAVLCLALLLICLILRNFHDRP